MVRRRQKDPEWKMTLGLGFRGFSFAEVGPPIPVVSPRYAASRVLANFEVIGSGSLRA